jgi:hypothetical protein
MYFVIKIVKKWRNYYFEMLKKMRCAKRQDTEGIVQ